MSRGLIASIAGVVGTVVLVAVAWFVAVSSASPDPAPNSVVLAPHGGSPTIYAGPGDREQVSGLWRFKKDASNSGLDKGYQTGKFGGGELVRTPFVPDATKIGGDRGMYTFRGTVGWYRTKIDVPADGTYAIRFESVNHRAKVWIDGKLEGEHKGEYLPFEVRAPLTAGTRHSLVVRADWRGPGGDEARRLAPAVVQLRRHQPRRLDPPHRRQRDHLSGDEHDADRRRGGRRHEDPPAQQPRAARSSAPPARSCVATAASR